MLGFFDTNDGQPKVTFKVQGEKTSGDVTALFDTGFSGELALPLQYLLELGAKLVGAEQMRYADGRTNVELLFEVKVFLEKEEKTVNAHLIMFAKEPIAGVRLFNQFTALINFSDKIFDIVETEILKGKLGNIMKS
ncbi:MAG: hypothetical protein Q7J30_02205 [Candidatus Azambacteria bacterium]|nr:hypothetical protein [Candidatus Azambacteria bacterium]